MEQQEEHVLHFWILSRLFLAELQPLVLRVDLGEDGVLALLLGHVGAPAAASGLKRYRDHRVRPSSLCRSPARALVACVRVGQSGGGGGGHIE